MRRVLGTITTDPAARLAVGSTFWFRSEIFPVGSPPGEHTIANWDHFGSALLRLHVRDGDALFVHGSAVLVAPGVAIAAKHVVEEFLPQLSVEGGASLTCISIIPSQLMAWTCKKITMLPETDLAILILSYATELPADATFAMAAITTRLPKVGEQVSMVGFTAIEKEVPFDPVGRLMHECPATSRFSVQNRNTRVSCSSVSEEQG